MSRRDLRLATGLVLFGYVALHLLNHALGLVSIGVAEHGLELALALWHSPPGTVLLYGAAGIHLGLAFESLYARRTLRMAPLDLTRIVLGLGIPTLLINHAVGTRLAWEMYHQSPQYSRVVWSLWSTDGQGRQLALLVPGWLHGCFGIHLAFAARPMYRRLHRPLFAAALLLPVLGGLGFLAMGKELAGDLAQRAALDAALELPRGASAALLGWRQTLLGLYLSACVAVFLARAARSWRERRARASIGIPCPQSTGRRRPQRNIRAIPLTAAADRKAEGGQAFRIVEQDVVLLCVDWRNREAVCRAVLPQDAVFLGAQFHRRVAPAARERGGLECDRSVSGTTLVFGIGIDLALACQSALSVASDVERALADLAYHWHVEFGVSADFSICIHMGPAAIGNTGPAPARRCAAAGPAIQAAQRLRTSTAGPRSLVSVEVLRRSGIPAGALDRMGLPQFEAAPGLRVAAPASLHLLARLGALGPA